MARPRLKTMEITDEFWKNWSYIFRTTCIGASLMEEEVAIQRPTPVKLIVTNPTSIEFSGKIHLEVPDTVKSDVLASALKIALGGQQSVELKFSRKNPGEWLPNKNLFKARVISCESVESVHLIFGLGGPRQWLVNEIYPYQNDKICCNPSAYGPYWDMWDKAKDNTRKPE